MDAAPNKPANKKAETVRTMKALDTSYDLNVPTIARGSVQHPARGLGSPCAIRIGIETLLWHGYRLEFNI